MNEQRIDASLERIVRVAYIFRNGNHAALRCPDEKFVDLYPWKRVRVEPPSYRMKRDSQAQVSMANLPSSDLQSRSLDFYPVAVTVFRWIFVHKMCDAHSIVRINETREKRAWKGELCEENCAKSRSVREFLLKWDSG